MEELRTILIDLTKEFISRKTEFTQMDNINYGFKAGPFAIPGSKRDSRKGQQMGVVIDRYSLFQHFTYFIRTFATAETLHNFIKSKGLWHENVEQFNGPSLTVPNTVGRVAGGFLCRNFELNNNEFIITESSFEQAYQELIDFFSKDFVFIQHYIHLKGVCGDVGDIVLNENVSIIRAGYDRARLFSINYTNHSPHNILGVEVYEDDYLLEINLKISKEQYKHRGKDSVHFIKEEQIEKWKYFVELAIPNFLVLGKAIQLSKDWPLEYDFAFGPYGHDRHIWNKPKVELKPEIIDNFYSIANVMSGIESMKNLDRKIIYGLERLAKSKSAEDINDRVIDLAISYEYLINTTRTDITLQLCLKLIKLVGEKANNDEIFKQLKEFYKLRSTVIHGNDKLLVDEKKIKIIEDTERLIRRAILKLIELNQLHTYKEIDKQLTRGLYRKESLDELLSTAGARVPTIQ